MHQSHFLVLICCLVLSACGGNKVVKPAGHPAPPATTSKPASSPTASAPVALPSKPSADTQVPQAGPSSVTESATKPGGYYLDDGPDANPPSNLDAIPDAIPKFEPPLGRSNKPYKALGKTYVPLKSAQNYTERGIASWYGKRFHGRKTSSGEIYDMYSMSAAHTVLPLPSYVKVTNPANGRSVVVRINDRGPFKHSRIIDLSYAAAHKLQLIKQGSGLVEVETIHPSQASSDNQVIASSPPVEPQVTSSAVDLPLSEQKVNPVQAPIETNISTTNYPAPHVPNEISATDSAITQYFIQAGAFKSEINAESLMKKIQGLAIEQNARINRVYNNGLHRLKLGPYPNRQEADLVASNIRKILNIAAFITHQ
ncbi:MAG: septal ring lytic transglycosylase RlpA family protein [Methylophilaceae bacterium]